MIYLQDADATLYLGDALDVLRELPDRSVHMCATSPPFFGLRDYQTGTWEGGDEGCDHKAPSRFDYSLQAKLGGDRPKPLTQESNAGSGTTAQYGATCGKCGATRIDRQIGLEASPDEWVARLVDVFREVRRVLRDDGTLWVEIGDSYTGPPRLHYGDQGKGLHRGDSEAHDELRKRTEIPSGMKPKDLLGQPWLLAFALRADGWYLRSEIIWHKLNAMPESCTDRPTKSHSTVFLLSKKPRYFMDMEAIREPHKHDGRHVTTVQQGNGSIQHRDGERWPGTGANARSVWPLATEPYAEAHFATWPSKLCQRMILAGTSERGVCPECGAPWVREVEAEYDAEGRSTNGPRSVERRHESPGRDVRMVKATSTLGWLVSCICGETDTSSTGIGANRAYTPVPATVLDPFAGSGTTLLVARKLGRRSIGIELSSEYAALATERLSQQSLLTELVP